MKKEHKGSENLLPFGTDPERDREIRSKGGKKAQELNKRKRALKDILDVMLALPATADILTDSDLTQTAERAAEAAGEKLTAYDAIALSMAVKASRGDVDAARWVRDSAGDKPTEKQQIVADVVTPADAEIAKRVAERLDKAKQNGE
jgi:hypothetical protein